MAVAPKRRLEGAPLAPSMLPVALTFSSGSSTLHHATRLSRRTRSRCVDVCASSFEECATLAYVVHERCMSEGYRLLGSEPGAMMTDDWKAWSEPLLPNQHATVCIPVVPGSDVDEDPNLRSFPETDAFSVIGFGRYLVIPELWRQLYEEMEAAGAEPAGPARLIALVAPYVGTHIRSDGFCYECIIPI